MSTWINFIHIYQPPTQAKDIIDQVVKESYHYLADILIKHPSEKFTINISGSLTKRLVEDGYDSLLNKFKHLAERGQIELVGSAMYHPILPKLPDHEIIRQIELNEQINKKVFGKFFSPTGFYLPEMAYDKRVANIIKKKGYKWILMDEIGLPKNEKYDSKVKYIIKDLNLAVIFRNREYSKTYVPKTILNLLNQKDSGPWITATDGELYGHYHTDHELLLPKLLEDPELKTSTCSEYINSLKNKKAILPRASTWESLESEIKNNVPYSLWADPKNKIHKKLWKFTDFAIATVNKNRRDPNFKWSRWHLDRGLASCTFWWCSGKVPSPFCPITWNPDEVAKGLNELIRSIRSLDKLPTKLKLQAEKLYFELNKMIWDTHWLQQKNK